MFFLLQFEAQYCIIKRQIKNFKNLAFFTTVHALLSERFNVVQCSIQNSDIITQMHNNFIANLYYLYKIYLWHTMYIKRTKIHHVQNKNTIFFDLVVTNAVASLLRGLLLVGFGSAPDPATPLLELRQITVCGELR